MPDETRVTLPAAGDRIPVNYDRTPTYERMIALKDVAVPMRDGVNLSVDIYRPDSAERFPVLLAFSIYNKDLQGPRGRCLAAPAARLVLTVGRALGGGRHQILRLAWLCSRHRFAARNIQIRRRRKPPVG